MSTTSYQDFLSNTDEGEQTLKPRSETTAKELMREVGAVLHTRSVPQLQFVFDEGIGGAIRMQELLKELNPQTEQGEPEGDEPPGDPQDGPPSA